MESLVEVAALDTLVEICQDGSLVAQVRIAAAREILEHRRASSLSREMKALTASIDGSDLADDDDDQVIE